MGLPPLYLTSGYGPDLKSVKVPDCSAKYSADIRISGIYVITQNTAKMRLDITVFGCHFAETLD